MTQKFHDGNLDNINWKLMASMILDEHKGPKDGDSLVFHRRRVGEIYSVFPVAIVKYESGREVRRVEIDYEVIIEEAPMFLRDLLYEYWMLCFMMNNFQCYQRNTVPPGLTASDKLKHLTFSVHKSFHELYKIDYSLNHLLMTLREYIESTGFEEMIALFKQPPQK